MKQIHKISLILSIALVILILFLAGCAKEKATALKECDKMIVQYKDSCYIDIAEKKQNLTICNKITDQYYKDACYSKVATKKQDLSICDKIVDQDDKDSCYEGIALIKQNTSLSCNEMNQKIVNKINLNSNPKIYTSFGDYYLQPKDKIIVNNTEISVTNFTIYNFHPTQQVLIHIPRFELKIIEKDNTTTINLPRIYPINWTYKQESFSIVIVPEDNSSASCTGFSMGAQPSHPIRSKSIPKKYRFLIERSALNQTTMNSKYSDIKENIFACKSKFNGWDGKMHTICYDYEGNKLFDATYAVLTESEFSNEKINEIEENYKSGCISKIKYSEIPPNIITQFIIKSDLFDQQDVCINVDKSIYSWIYNNYKYYYSISSTTGGGNFEGTYWELNVEPYTMNGINTGKYPFLSCENYFAYKYQSWHISVKKDNNTLKIVVDNVKPPVQTKDLDEDGLNKLSEDFTTCNASYSY